MYYDLLSFFTKDERLAKCCKFAQKYREYENFDVPFNDFFGEEKTKEEVEEIFVEALKKFIDFVFLLDKEAKVRIEDTNVTPDTEINMDFYKEKNIDLFGDYEDYEQPDIRVNGTYIINTRFVYNDYSFVTSEFDKQSNPDIIINETKVIVGDYIDPYINFHLLNQHLRPQISNNNVVRKIFGD